LPLSSSLPGDMRDNVSGFSPSYHPSYEFPGGDDINSHIGASFRTNPDSSSSPANGLPICRLVIQEGRFVSGNRRLAVIDGYSEVQFGRDAPPPGVTTPRVRLRDMEVSKLHATLFWDAQRTEWAVVDMGSKHGTFVGSGQDANPVRLSAARVASMPKRLKHLDRLSLGGTTFQVHIHENRLPCSDCSASGQGSDDDLIPLFSHHRREDGAVTQTERSRKRGADATDHVPRNAKRALASLKHSLLSRPGGSVPAMSPPQDEPARPRPSGHGAVRRCEPPASDTKRPPPGMRSRRERSGFVPTALAETTKAGRPASESEQDEQACGY